jgi:MFS family permease
LLKLKAPQRAALGVLALCALMNMLSRGVGESFAVFLLPIAREFGTDRAALTGVYSTYMLVVGLMSPLAGLAIDRLGPRICYSAGLFMFGLAYALAGWSQSLWHLYLLIGGLSAMGSSLIGSVTASGLVSRWFRERLPTAMGILAASLGTGMLLIAPLMQAVVERWGWRQAYSGLGITALIMLVPLLLLPWKRIAAGSPEVLKATASRASTQAAWTASRALRTRMFWALSGVMFFTSVTTYTIGVQLVASFIDAGLSPLHAASVFGLVGMVSIVGMMGAGVLAEKFGERAVATLSYSSTILGIGVLSLMMLHPSQWLVTLFVILFGTMQGSRGPLVAVLAARHYPGAMGLIYGMVMMCSGVGAAVGSWASGHLYDMTHSYQAGFALAATSAACGLSIFWGVRQMDGKNTAR